MELAALLIWFQDIYVSNFGPAKRHADFIKVFLRSSNQMQAQYFKFGHDQNFADHFHFIVHCLSHHLTPFHIQTTANDSFIKGTP
jgi:hypothetical protein